MKRFQAGFSLIEIMIVVAIAGILTTIAIPKYQQYRARSAQMTAKVELSGIYTVEAAFQVAHGTYHADWQAIGYYPEGVSNYADAYSPKTNRYYGSAPDYAWFGSLTTVPVDLSHLGLPSDPGPFYGWPSSTTHCGLSGLQAGLVWNSYNAVAPTICGHMTQNSFCAMVSGCPITMDNPMVNTYVGFDTWIINDQRVLKQINNLVN